jgi:hypothetical protein
MPHRQDVEAATELQPLGLGREPKPGLDQVRDDLVALALEMVLGHPEDVEAEIVHGLGDVLRGREHLAQPFVGVTPVVGRGTVAADIVELDLADIEHMEFRDHALRPAADAGSLAHVPEKWAPVFRKGHAQKLWRIKRRGRYSGRKPNVRSKRF